MEKETLLNNLFNAIGLAEVNIKESQLSFNEIGQYIPNYIADILEENESWRYIKGYPRYIVTNKGRIINMITGRIMKQSKHYVSKASNKYFILNVPLSLPYQGSKVFAVHKLVADAFLDEPKCNPDGSEFKTRLCINHKDGDTTNNNVDNLEWCDQTYNSKVGDRVGKQSKKGPKPNSERGKYYYYSLEELLNLRTTYNSYSREYAAISKVIWWKKHHNNKENK